MIECSTCSQSRWTYIRFGVLAVRFEWLTGWVPYGCQACKRRGWLRTSRTPPMVRAAGRGVTRLSSHARVLAPLTRDVQQLFAERTAPALARLRSFLQMRTGALLASAAWVGIFALGLAIGAVLFSSRSAGRTPEPAGRVATAPAKASVPVAPAVPDRPSSLPPEPRATTGVESSSAPTTPPASAPATGEKTSLVVPAAPVTTTAAVAPASSVATPSPVVPTEPGATATATRAAAPAPAHPAVMPAAPVRTAAARPAAAPPPAQPGTARPKVVQASVKNPSTSSQRVTSSAGTERRESRTPKRETATRRAAVPLTAAPSLPKFHGTLSIRSEPEGARVSIDGRVVGATPLQLSAVPAGSRVIRIESEGYERWSSAARVVANRQTSIVATLQRAAGQQ